MEITKIKQEKANDNPHYILTIHTMEGDDDDNHSISFKYYDEESKVDKLKEAILSCHVLKKTFPDGRGGCDEYCGPHFEKFNRGDEMIWPYSCANDMTDSFCDYELEYFNGDDHYVCGVKLSEEDLLFIKNEPQATYENYSDYEPDEDEDYGYEDDKDWDDE